MFLTTLTVTLHLLGVGIVVGVVFATLLFLQRNMAGGSSLKMLQATRQLGTIGAIVAILSGIVMAFRYGIPLKGNWLFDAKLLLVAADGLIANQIIKKQVDAAVSGASSNDLQKKLLGWAWLSVIIIVAVVVISVYRGKLRG